MGFFYDMGESLRVQYMTNPFVMRYWHVHPQYEMYFCPQGLPQRSVINGQEFFYDYPCVILSTPYSIHSMSCVQDVAIERIVVYFGERTLGAIDRRLMPPQIFDHRMGRLFPLTPSDVAVLRPALATLLAPLQETTEAERELCFMQFLHKLVQRVPSEKVISIGTSDHYIQSVLQYVFSHISENLDSGTIAKAFAVSRSKLDRDFRKCTGVTTHAFVDACRINQAKVLLADRREEKSICEIASACGFASETYFYSYFKKHEGLSPNEYRASVRSGKITLDQADDDCCR